MSAVAPKYEDFAGLALQLKSALEQRTQQEQVWGAQFAENKQEFLRVNHRLDLIEVALQRPGYASGGPGSAEGTPAAKVFWNYVRKGMEVVTPDERGIWTKALNDRWGSETKALSLTDETMGGFLAPPEFVNEIIKYEIPFSPIRTIANVRSTSAREVLVPVRKSTMSAIWVSETAGRSETTGLKYGRERLVSHEMYAEVILSRQDMEDSAFNLDQEVQSEVAIQFGVAEGAAFIIGTGVGQPEGLLTNPNITTINTGDAAKVTYQGLLDICHDLKSAYIPGACWIMNRKTIGKIRGITDTQGQPLWLPAINSGFMMGNPATILDLPYVECPDMPDVAGNAFPIMFGNFKRGYYILDRVQMEVQRLQEKYAESGQVAILVRKRVGGQVVLADALRKQKVA